MYSMNVTLCVYMDIHRHSEKIHGQLGSGVVPTNIIASDSVVSSYKESCNNMPMYAYNYVTQSEP